MRRHLIISLGTASLLLSASCRHDTGSLTNSTKIAIVRTEQSIKNGYQEDDSLSIRGVRLLLQAFGCSGIDHSDSLLIDAVDSIKSTEAFRLFEPDVTEKYENLSHLEQTIAMIGRNWRLGPFPDNFYSAVSPYRQSIIINDTTDMIIALNHYMGVDYKPYDAFPEYLRSLKTEDRIGYDIVYALVNTNYPFDSQKAYLLNRMAYEGCLIAAAMVYIDNASLTTALGWTDAQLKWAQENEHKVWEYMAGHDMIYSDSPTLGSQVNKISPSTSVITSDAPGGLGRYIGYRLVNSYLKSHKDISLDKFISEKIYMSGTLLRDSGYRP